MIDSSPQHFDSQFRHLPHEMPSVHKTSQLLSLLLTPEEISSIAFHFKLYDTVPFISFHGLKNCGIGHRGWNQDLEFTINLVYVIYQMQGLLCANLRKEQGTFETTSGRISCANLDGIDYRSASASDVRSRARSQGFAPACHDSHWGFPEYPTIMFSLLRDRQEYKSKHPNEIPNYQHERSVEQITRSEFIALCLCNEDQTRYFINCAKDSDPPFEYKIPVLCGKDYLVLPDFSNVLSSENYHLMPRSDFEAWLDWITESQKIDPS